MRYLDAANRGNAEAMFLVSLSFENGSEGQQDPQAAFGWAKRAAEANHAMAQFHLGTLYERGVGVVASVDQARHWYGVAAHAGVLEAKANLARLLFDAGDYHTALPWWQQVADTGDQEGLFFVGLAHNYGLGTQVNGAMAVDYYSRAADAGNESASFNLGKMYFDGELVENNFYAAFKYLEPLADQGDVHACYYLGGILFNGWGVAADHARAFHYVQRAAEGGIARAQYQLATFYSSGMGVEQSDAQAQYWMERSRTNPDQSSFG